MRWLTLALSLGVVAWLWWPLVFENNLHPVIPGQVFRSAQPSPDALTALTSELGIRSVFSLRGGREAQPWFPKLRAAAERHGVQYHSLRLSGERMPSAQNLRELVRLLDSLPRPLLLHCLQGVERTGLAASVALLLNGAQITEARRQLGLRYGFWQLQANSDLPAVLDQYGAWLAEGRWIHSPDRFRAWVQAEYVPYFYRAQIEPVALPEQLTAGTVTEMRFRVTNTSRQPWRFGSSRERGVHLDGELRSLDPSRPQRVDAHSAISGRVLRPRESVVLSLDFPPLSEPGPHRLEVDLVDQKVAWFADMGSEPYRCEIEVRPAPATPISDER